MSTGWSKEIYANCRQGKGFKMTFLMLSFMDGMVSPNRAFSATTAVFA